ncbi:MAG: polyprenyl diphosphate synthase [Gammaproteobacteria bacterium]|nr:polyprenyl diphosphate synthase [Gammaproteobacteria bacterium]
MSDATDTQIPQHVAIIMDGNGRWAKQRRRPRVFGHRAGQESAEAVIRAAREAGVKVLTLFAFSSENWKRPEDEVSNLMGLLAAALEKQVARLAEAEIRLRFVGNLDAFSSKLVKAMHRAEKETGHLDGMLLNVAVGYGGRWDIIQAAERFSADVAAGKASSSSLDETGFSRYLSLGDCPDVDLLVRTGGERRISNFLLWQLAYAELYFTDTLWPDFDGDELQRALAWFAERERRFGGVTDVDTEEAGNA